ncbi:restriction endonuclease [Luteimonas sp. SDU82]|uniref:restriction endonuclease n=1 Tax=Luteimonas sp. SDU82 TaxID=3422592 RepID=UPI003EC03EFC
MNQKQWPGWQVYERLVARLIADQAWTGMCVTPNARIIGRISGRSRQIDVLLEIRHDTDNSRRVVVDAKKRERPVGVRDVEALRGLMDDVDATHGYLVSPSGHTKAAERRAQELVSLRILPLDRLDDFDPSSWPDCRDPRCKRGRVFWDGYPEISITLQPLHGGSSPTITTFVHYVGKCDQCGRFHVRCLTCNALFNVPQDQDDDGHRCQCRMPWFWLASIEEDEAGRRSAELHFCSVHGPRDRGSTVALNIRNAVAHP